MPAVSGQLHDFIMPAEPAIRPAGSGWFARLSAAFVDMRLRQAEREVARFIEASGGRMTDELERNIERRFI